MTRSRRLLVITFLESFATILVERGIFFFSHERLHFTDSENLGLALGFGLAYVAGALSSHAVAGRLSEKRVVLGSLVAQALVHGALCLWHGSAPVASMNVVLGLLAGLKWPVVESYVSAGHTPAVQAGTIGRFNLSWAGAVPAALAAAGPLIRWRPEGLFAAAGLLSVASLGLVWPLERRPVHLPEDHPERPRSGQLARYVGLLASCRWSMISSYSLMWILAALLPGVFADLDIDVTWATALSGLLDVFRFATFLALGLWRGWHNRAWPLGLVIVGLPAGFAVALGGRSLAAVLAGELVFGLAAGMTYYAALYYAMVVKNAAVEAGGAHESLIGTGFAVGPVAGLAGRYLAPALGGPMAGMAAGVGPVVAVCAAGAARALVKVVRAGRASSPPPGG